MRRTAAAVFVAVLALTGCSSGGDEAGAKPSAGSSPSITPGDRFLAAAHGITFNGAPSDVELLAYPPKWCDGLAAGHSVEWLFDVTGGGGLYPVGMDWGTAKADANTLLVAGVTGYCPEHLAVVTEELRASGAY